MNNHIYIADTQDNNMFDVMPSFDTGTELPPPPVSNNSEMDTFMSKSFTSFGAMAICIVVILLLALIFKRKKNEVQSFDNPKFETKEEVKEVQEIEQQPAQIKRRKASKLRTPNTLSKCIKAFLENTKEN